jgi:hypothetical protein
MTPDVRRLQEQAETERSIVTFHLEEQHASGISQQLFASPGGHQGQSPGTPGPYASFMATTITENQDNIELRRLLQASAERANRQQAQLDMLMAAINNQFSGKNKAYPPVNDSNTSVITDSDSDCAFFGPYLRRKLEKGNVIEIARWCTYRKHGRPMAFISTEILYMVAHLSASRHLLYTVRYMSRSHCCTHRQAYLMAQP